MITKEQSKQYFHVLRNLDNLEERFDSSKEQEKQICLRINLENLENYIEQLEKENEDLNDRIDFLDSFSKEDKYEDWGEDR